jgi:hypothetical protein
MTALGSAIKKISPLPAAAGGFEVEVVEIRRADKILVAMFNIAATGTAVKSIVFMGGISGSYAPTQPVEKRPLENHGL